MFWIGSKTELKSKDSIYGSVLFLLLMLEAAVEGKLQGFAQKLRSESAV